MSPITVLATWLLHPERKDSIWSNHCYSVMPRNSAKSRQKFPVRCSLLSGNACEACIELIRFDTQHMALPGSQRNTERSLLLQQVNARHDPLVLNFPVEIIAKIFGFYPEMSGYTAAVCAPQPQGVPTSPFRITSVCKRWREIGFSTSSLWASLLIGFNCPTLDPAHRRSWLNGIELLSPWLTRSGTQKLNISIQCSRFKYSCLPPEMKAMFKLIKCYACRWVTLNLTMPGHFCEEFFQENHLTAPHLTHLQLHELQTYYPQSRPHVMIYTPSLDTIAITNMDMSRARLDYSRITCVCIGGITGDQLCLLLKYAVRLERAALIRPNFHINAVPWDAHVHESLVYLDLRFQENQHSPILAVNQALNAFAFPHLQHLSIRFGHGENSMEQSLFTLLSRSRCHLVRLELTNLDAKALSHTALVQILEVVPSLTHLRLASPRHTISSLVQRSFRGLSGAGMAPQVSFLPSLESLMLEEWPSPSDDFFYLSDIFASSTRPLRAIQLTFVMDDTRPMIVIPYKALAQLRRLQNKGENQTFQLSITLRHERNGGAREVDLVEESWKTYGATRT